MCTCASCEYTDRFGGMQDLFGAPVSKDHHHGWEWWPRGDPQGKRASESDYRAHVSYGNRIRGSSHGGDRVREVPAFKITPEPHFPSWVTCQLNGPLPYPSALVQRFTTGPIVARRHLRAVGRLVQVARDLRQAEQERRAA